MIKTYVDTGVLFHAWRSKDPDEKRRAREILIDVERSLVFSDYTLLEIMPKAKHFNNLQEVGFFEAVVAAAEEIVPASRIEYAEVFDLACSCGLAAIDAFHAQAAIVANVDEFVTTEKKGKAFFKVAELKSVSLTSI